MGILKIDIKIDLLVGFAIVCVGGMCDEMKMFNDVMTV